MERQNKEYYYNQMKSTMTRQIITILKKTQLQSKINEGNSNREKQAIFQSLRYDQKWHPINKRPQSGNTATHRKWMQGQENWLAQSQQTKSA